MNTFFYSHLVSLDSIVADLDTLGLSKEEKKQLIDLAHSNLHHAIIDTILSELSQNDKKTFLRHLAMNDHTKIWNHLNKKVEKIEEKIIKTAEDLKLELKKDFKSIKKS